LCDLCRSRFADAVANGRLVILNVAVAGNTSRDSVTFYVHRTEHVISQLAEPEPSVRDQFDAIQVPQRSASDIVKMYGAPHYIKVDIEGMDGIVLKDLFSAGIVPDFISAESHSLYPFALLVSHGYDSFNLIDGRSVADRYGSATIRTPAGPVNHAFPAHAAGPYGEDITTPWWHGDAFLDVLASERLGWKDIHASRVIPPGSQLARLKLGPKAHVRDLVPSVVRSLKARVRARRRAITN
jgi:FkbM family methyltransferase